MEMQNASPKVSDAASVGKKQVISVLQKAVGGKKQFISMLRSEFIKSPLASNVVLGLILTVLESVLDVEFACPCKPRLNELFASAYFIIPGAVASVLMLVIKGYKFNSCPEKGTLCLFGLFPIMLWLIIVFLDGQYFACARTYWSGRFVVIDKAAPQRWCEPANSTLSLEKMSLTQDWYFYSQTIGIFLLAVLVIGVIIGVANGLMDPKSETSTQDVEMNEPKTT